MLIEYQDGGGRLCGRRVHLQILRDERGVGVEGQRAYGTETITADWTTMVHHAGFNHNFF